MLARHLGFRPGRRLTGLLQTTAIGVILAHPLGLTLAWAAPAATSQSSEYTFSVPAQGLTQALHSIVKQAGVPLSLNEALTNGKTAPSVQGKMTLTQALQTALQGSGLSASVTDSGVQITSASTRADVMLDKIAVIGNRSEQSLENSAAVVSVIDSTDWEDKGIHRMQELGKMEPGVTVTNDSKRSGAGGYNIRGIQDNRILMMVDGVKLPDLPGGVLLRGGGYTPYTRDMVDLDSLKKVEILRGPGSALYGSDAIGGVVAYTTKDPADYLHDGKDTYASAKVGFDSLDESWSETGTAAARAGEFSALASYTRRDGEDVKTDFKGRSPQDYNGNNMLGKLVYDHGADRIGLTGEVFQRKYDSDIYGERTTTYSDVDATDETRRSRISLQHTHDEPLGIFDKIDWKAYYTHLRRTEDRIRVRSAGGYEQYIQTSEQDIFGGDLQFNTKTDWGGVDNLLTYGLSADFTMTDRLREYSRWNASGALISNTTPEGNPTPSRFFPNTNTLQGGVFGQDEISLGALTLTPGLRYDYYRLKPDQDGYYSNNATTNQAKEVEESALSPKLGAVYKITPTYSVFGQYAHGFRAPPYDDANSGFRNSVAGGLIQYEFLPNPDLKAETSKGVEGGFRGKFDDGSSFQVSSFYNRYHNFIDMKTIAAPAIGTVGQYQAINVDKVVIYGAEGTGEWAFAPEWRLSGSLAYAEGENKETGAAIDSVAPLTMQVGLNYDASNALWGAGILAKHAFAHDQVSSPDYYTTKAYTTVDLNAYYSPVEWVTLRASVSNLLDERVISFSDVEKVSAANMTDAYVSAGRSFTLNATVEW